jgi:hypothetical protein
MFVSMTRAKQRLFVMHNQNQPPSQYLDEIPADLKFHQVFVSHDPEKDTEW